MLLQEIPTPQAGAGRWHMDAFKRAFGDPIDRALWAASDPLALASRLDPAAAPALRFDCGAQDRFGLAAGNQALHRLLEARGVAHEFALPPGDHGYEYVRTVLADSLRFLARGARDKPKAP
jgi:S-formylglutathione hydrolase FrmB